MSLESQAGRIENEAMTSPTDAASGMRLLEAAQQDKLINQMQKDANTQDASFRVEHDNKGELKAIYFEPLFHESGPAGAADAATRRS